MHKRVKSTTEISTKDTETIINIKTTTYDTNITKKLIKSLISSRRFVQTQEIKTHLEYQQTSGSN